MKRRRDVLGAALVETTVATALAIAVLGAGSALVGSGSDLARSAAAGDIAARHAERALLAFEDAIRSGSLAAVRRVDGTTFADGAFDDGMSGRRVVGYSGNPVLGTRFKLRWVADATGTSGDVFREQDGVTEMIAHGVPRFRVTRTGSAFTVSVTAFVQNRGTWDRTVRGTTTVSPRNQ